MSGAPPFDDQRHRRSEELAFVADRHARAGRLDEARDAYGRAAPPELELAREVSEPVARGLFATSAVNCYLRARLWDDASRAAHEFLAQPDRLSEAAREELETLLDDGLRQKALFAAMGAGGDAAPLEVRLGGGLVGRGIAPSSLVQERQEITAALVFRVADYKASRKFRKAGPSSFMGKLALYDAPATAGSYGIRFYVASSGQVAIPGTDVSPRDAVDELLALATVAAEEGPEGIRSRVQSADYATAFIRSFRDLAPDGGAVATVSFASPTSLYRREIARFSPASRARLSDALVDKTASDPFSVLGVLKAVSLRRSRKIVVEADDGGVHQIRLKGAEHDDTIGPKLNRRVQVNGTRSLGKDGVTVSTASDIVVVEGPASP